MERPLHRPEFLNTTDDDNECFLTRKQVVKITGLCYPSIWQLMRTGDFPAARIISKNRVGWLKSSIVAWLRSRPLQVYKPPNSAARPRKGGAS
jgi:predicted DNA-binding transcriptional regulator AlpA